LPVVGLGFSQVFSCSVRNCFLLLPVAVVSLTVERNFNLKCFFAYCCGYVVFRCFGVKYVGVSGYLSEFPVCLCLHGFAFAVVFDEG